MGENIEGLKFERRMHGKKTEANKKLKLLDPVYTIRWGIKKGGLW
jgi:hypothetical protein